MSFNIHLGSISYYSGSLRGQCASLDVCLRKRLSEQHPVFLLLEIARLYRVQRGGHVGVMLSNHWQWVDITKINFLFSISGSWHLPCWTWDFFFSSFCCEHSVEVHFKSLPECANVHTTLHCFTESIDKLFVSVKPNTVHAKSLGCVSSGMVMILVCSSEAQG